MSRAMAPSTHSPIPAPIPTKASHDTQSGSAVLPHRKHRTKSERPNSPKKTESATHSRNPRASVKPNPPAQAPAHSPSPTSATRYSQKGHHPHRSPNWS